MEISTEACGRRISERRSTMRIIPKREPERAIARPRGWDPFETMQELLRWDPFRPPNRVASARPSPPPSR